MSIIENAKREMQLAGYDGIDIAAIEDIMQRFFSHWDSGGAVSIMIPVLDRLLRGMPLNCLTGDGDEWHDPTGEGLLQNIRYSGVFKSADGRIYDIDNPSWDGSFPYLPPRHDLSPVIEFSQAPRQFEEAEQSGADTATAEQIPSA